MLLNLLVGRLCRVSRVRCVRSVCGLSGDEPAVSALSAAWLVTVIATAALYAALAIAPVWDSAS
jgi:hypothetical protein